MSTSSPHVVDDHLHLWDRSRFDYPWMTDLPALPHTSLPPDITTSGAVVIEAGARMDQAIAEVDWLTELSHHSPRIWGVVAAVDLTDPRLGEMIAQLLENAFVVGVRDNFEGRPLGELDLYSSPVARALRGGIIAVLEAGLTFDICVRSAQLPELINLLTSIVEVRGSATGLVLDHLGKPLPDGPHTGREDWARSMTQLADLPGLHTKFSGLPGQIPGEVDVDRAQELVHEHLEVVDAFGADRTMFGTDHPVSTIAHGLETSDWVCAATSEFRDRLTAAELASVAGGTAIEFYGLRRHP